MKKLALTFALALFMISCSSQVKFADRFKNAKPDVINGQVTRFDKNEFGSYTVSVITKEYGKVQIHWVPCTAYLISIPVYVARNGNLHYRKT
jgi:hypothetical protein